MSLARALAGEVIGTFALVFAGCGAIVVDAKTQALGQVGIAATFGLVIMAMVYALGHVSGAHFDPAVTFAFALTRHFPWPRVGAYWAAQLAGALVAALLLRSSLGDLAEVGATLPSGSRGQGLRLGARPQLLPDARDHGCGNRHAGSRRGRRHRNRRHRRARCALRRPISGASMNPARSLAPAIVAANLDAVWIYLTAPLVGATLGALAYGLVRGETPRPGEVAA